MGTNEGPEGAACLDEVLPLRPGEAEFKLENIFGADELSEGWSGHVGFGDDCGWCVNSLWKFGWSVDCVGELRSRKRGGG